MLIKAGVSIDKLNREIRRVLGALAAWTFSFGEELVITRTFEGNHRVGSLHYCNNAVDIRRPEAADALDVKRLKLLVGEDYNIFTAPGQVHVEYDPGAISSAEMLGAKIGR